MAAAMGMGAWVGWSEDERNTVSFDCLGTHDNDQEVLHDEDIDLCCQNQPPGSPKCTATHQELVRMSSNPRSVSSDFHQLLQRVSTRQADYRPIRRTLTDPKASNPWNHLVRLYLKRKKSWTQRTMPKVTAPAIAPPNQGR